MGHFYRKYHLFIFIGIFLTSCAPTRFVETLDKNQHAIGINIGGPTIDFLGIPLAVPFSSVYYGYGVDSNITVYGGLHTTSLLFNNLHLDYGATLKLLEPCDYAPGISVSPFINSVIDLDSPASKFWPALDVNTYWHIGQKKHLLYTGFNNWFELSATRFSDEPTIANYLFIPHLGFTYKAKKLEYTLESKLIAPTVDNSKMFVPYKSIIGNKGASGIYFSVIKKF